MAYNNMKKQDLVRILKTNKNEWNDLEFKEAGRELPKSAYETVSAFSNTHGGWIVFGIAQIDNKYTISGVISVDKVQNDFLSALRADQKVNHDILVQEKLFEIEGKKILAFYIPEASRQHKPIYLNGDIRRSYIRRGGCDQRCNLQEIERFLRDATAERWDSETVDFNLNQAFDKDSLKWYRHLLHERNPGYDETLSDKDFLLQWGYLIRKKAKLMPTRASILLFGTPIAVRQMLPRPIVDVQWIPGNLEGIQPEVRWLDRVIFEENLISSWRGLIARYMQKVEKPFSIDPHTLLRNEAPPDYRVFRELFVNLLIHQDYADHSRKAVIKFYRDSIEFWNPGDVFGSVENLLEPGEKEVRNPRIVAAFRRLGLCEQAGTGVKMVITQWQALGYPIPKYANDRSRKAFGVLLPLQLKEAAYKEQVSEQVSEQVKQILKYCQTPRSKREILNHMGLGFNYLNYKRHIQQLVERNLLEMLIPHKPNSRLQKYQTSKKGERLL